MDIETAANILFFFKFTNHRYSDGNPWIHRRSSVDTATELRGYIDEELWIERRKTVDEAPKLRGYIDDRPWIHRRPDRDT